MHFADTHYRSFGSASEMESIDMLSPTDKARSAGSVSSSTAPSTPVRADAVAIADTPTIVTASAFSGVTASADGGPTSVDGFEVVDTPKRPPQAPTVTAVHFIPTTKVYVTFPGSVIKTSIEASM